MFIALIALSACEPGDTSFTNINSDVEVASGSSALVYDPLEIVFVDLKPDLTYSDVLNLASNGESNLLIYDVRIVDDEDDVFYLSGSETGQMSDELAPGTSRNYTLIAVLSDEVPLASANLRIKTNDPDQLDFTLPMSAALLVEEDTGQDTGS